MKTIKLHSIIDLITNSSTEIFTVSEGSILPCIEMVNEILDLMGETRRCEDIFNLAVLPDKSTILDRMWEEVEDDGELRDYIIEVFGEDSLTDDDILERTYDHILKENKSLPWFEEMRESVAEYTDTTLVITVKDPKFEKLAEYITTFLYSTESQEKYC